jgi:hypothetical protein
VLALLAQLPIFVPSVFGQLKGRLIDIGSSIHSCEPLQQGCTAIQRVHTLILWQATWLLHTSYQCKAGESLSKDRPEQSVGERNQSLVFFLYFCLQSHGAGLGGNDANI